jgi:RNA polymerase sigma-70 factor (ECF subfamily)
VTDKTQPPEPEADLVRACAEGDRAAWERFVARYGALISALARRMLYRRLGRASDADVEEVASEVFVALLKGDRRLLRRYRPEFRVTTYLGVICRTEVGKYLRRAGRHAAYGGEEVAERADPSLESPLQALARREREQALRALLPALERLPPRDRLLLSLRYVDGLDYGRIAAVLRVGRESVGQLLHRAKGRLARLVPALRDWTDAETPQGPP